MWVSRPLSLLTAGPLFGTRGRRSELFTDPGCDASSQNLDGPQHLLMRERRDAHLERNAREAAEDIVHVQYLLRDHFGIANEQRTCGSTHRIELPPRSCGPAAFLSKFSEGVRVPGIKRVC